MTPDDNISHGEFDRWLESDREWKGQVLDHLIGHGERLASLETIAAQVTRAESAATGTKRWAVVGGVIAAIINGFLLTFGSGSK